MSVLVYKLPFVLSAKDYGGVIEVESEVRVGTTFKVTFPAADSDKERLEENSA